MKSSNLPKISIHILSYNQPEFIRQAVDGALAQDYPNLEVVVADDASTDGTAEILADYQRRNPKRMIAVLGTENVGITKNSNRGLASCSGELIAFMGGDDILLPGKISAQAAWFNDDSRRVLCGHRVEVFFDDGTHPTTVQPPTLLSGVGVGSYIRHRPYAATSVMVRRDRIPSYGFDERLPTAADQLLWFDVIGRDGNFGGVDGIFARYRRHSGNAHLDVDRNCLDNELMLRLLRERYPEFTREINFADAHLSYVFGAMLMRQGRKTEARSKLLRALRHRPLAWKAWVRLLACLN
jgi:glycosyltransferase involved in cell wall biosynthesis